MLQWQQVFLLTKLYVNEDKKERVEILMKKTYEGLSDEEIIEKIRQGENDAVDFLMEKYKNLVRRKAANLFLIGADKEDLIQEGMIGLYKAIRDYQIEQENASSFYTFADLCISRQMYSAIKASKRKKNIPLNTYISLYGPAFGETKGEENLESHVNFIHREKNLNPEELVIDKENSSVLEYTIERRLSTLEKKVLKYYRNGLSYVEIASLLGRSPKSVDNALQRIKTKLNQILKELN